MYSLPDQENSWILMFGFFDVFSQLKPKSVAANAIDSEIQTLVFRAISIFLGTIRKRCQFRMALPSFNIVFHLVALINSSLAILLGLFSSATTFGRRLFALGSTRSGRWPTVWLADVSNDN